MDGFRPKTVHLKKEDDMLISSLENEFELIDKIQTHLALMDFFDQESTGIKDFEIVSMDEQNYKNIINDRKRRKK